MVSGSCPASLGKNSDADLAGQLAQLLDGGGPVHVAAHQQGFLVLALLEPAGQLGDAGGLAGALQARHQHHRRRLDPQVQFRIRLAHDPDQFFVHDLDQHLAGRQAEQHLLAHRPLAHPGDEIPHHRQRHVRFQQRHAHLAQGVLDVVLGQAALAAQILDGAQQALAEIFEHADPPSLQSEWAGL